MEAVRRLRIVADDYGIGRGTSRGILDLAAQGCLSATVLLVNSPFAEEAVRDWRHAGGSSLVELGWHPCLTLDQPLLPARRVSSLVRPDGSFLSLGQFLRRALTGRLAEAEVRAELQAQYERFQQLTGQAPRIINAHHHVHVFPGVASLLMDVLARQQPRPHVRRVVETTAMLQEEKRARGKRVFLSTLGRRSCPALKKAGFPGNDVLAGITDPQGLAWPDLDRAGASLCRWLDAAPQGTIELMCHPGHHDEAARRCDEPSALSRLIGRWLPGLAVECGPEVRVRELELLAHPSLRGQLEQYGFQRSERQAA